MADEGYALTGDFLLRVADAVRTVEGNAIPQSRGLRARGPALESAQFQILKVTSTTTSGGYYPAKWQLYDTGSSSWTDKADCWLQAANGETLTTQRYLGICISSYNGAPLYSTYCC